MEAGFRLAGRNVPLAAMLRIAMLPVMMDGISQIHNVILAKVRGEGRLRPKLPDYPWLLVSIRPVSRGSRERETAVFGL